MTPEVPAPAPGGSPGAGEPGPDGGASVGPEGAPGAGVPDGGASVEREGAPRRPRAERKQVLLRLDPAVHDALARWASDELRSVNAQIDMVLRRALDAEGRLPRDVRPPRRPGRPPAE
ncbi:hypothetical protein [Oerskovia sp. Root918]|uniref:hypothetical protein n=1 Tax=Oerskovia sp. Root918 TaxID=1736607 RepID=UPI000A66DBD6|nr:hypothetical protein [Oerskovia sp. Root918]